MNTHPPPDVDPHRNNPHAVGISVAQAQLMIYSPYVRKCTGKNRQGECFQQSNHPNTRWECSFASPNRDEFMKHCKNIMKRTKWKELVENMKPDDTDQYRCVYFSTDRNHVENHYKKGSGGELQGEEEGTQQYPKRGRWKSDESFDGRPDLKKMRQDATLLQGLYMQENGNHEGAATTLSLPDTFKTEELMNLLEKKLALDHDMCVSALSKLHSQGFNILGPLRALSKEAWLRLELPLALEEEIKSQIASKVYNPFYIPSSPVAGIPGWGSMSYWQQQGQGNYPYYPEGNGEESKGSKEDEDSPSGGEAEVETGSVPHDSIHHHHEDDGSHVDNDHHHDQHHHNGEETTVVTDVGRLEDVEIQNRETKDEGKEEQSNTI